MRYAYPGCEPAIEVLRTFIIHSEAVGVIPGGLSWAGSIVSGTTPPERRGNNLKRFKDVHLEAKARIWP